MEIELSQQGKNKGLYKALIDDKHYKIGNLSWSLANNRGKKYARKDVDGKQVYLHRIILAEKLGRSLLDTELVDHIDGNGLNCLESNLRLATHAENVRNSGIPSHNTSGVRGVHWCRHISKWQAKIKENGKTINLGYYLDLKQAADVWDEAAREIHGEFAFQNNYQGVEL